MQLVRILISTTLPALLVAQSPRDSVRPLPTPSGRHAIGTAVSYLVDTARRADFAQGRPVTVQVWYPAQPARRATAPYLVEPALGAELLKSQYYGMDSATIQRWRDVRTHSHADARAAGGRFPLVAFSVGQGVIRAQYTSIAEELASHGYVVALVESPLQGFMVRPDGQVISDTAGRFGSPAAHLLGAAEWAKDISFALDRLEHSLPPGRMIDWSRVGAAGHSSGGIVAVQACADDGRIRACADLDGGVAGPAQEPMAPFVTRGVAKPALFLRSQPLYDDSTLARRKITRAEWVKRGEGGRLGFDSLMARSTGPIDLVSVAGTGHFSFSDAPFVMPTAITRFGGRIIEPQRGWEVITAVLRAYFDERLRGERGALARVVGRFPELAEHRLAPRAP